MSDTDGLVAAINDLLNGALGGDWYDFRDRLEAWANTHPRAAWELVHYARELMEAWEHE